MKTKILMDAERPKVRLEDAVRIVKKSGMELSDREPDFAIVIGGDGLFSRYGSMESIPLLFVGVRAEKAVGSKAYLASAYFDELETVLKRISDGKYGVVEYRRLEVILNKRRLGDVFTDVYFQRGAESNSIRYKVQAEGNGINFTEFAIGDGVVICTKAGSTGYFSYLDKLRLGDWLDPDRVTIIEENEVGVCHIAPSFTWRTGTAEHPLRYTLPWGTTIKITLVREADARLYGIGMNRRGIRVRVNDIVKVVPSERYTQVIKVKPLS